jgi:hypothetical protein
MLENRSKVGCWLSDETIPTDGVTQFSSTAMKQAAVSVLPRCVFGKLISAGVLIVLTEVSWFYSISPN